MATNQNTRPVRNDTIVEHGSDFIGRVVVKADPTTASDRILLNVPISPSFFPGTRLTILANTWEYYRFTSLRIRYVPAVPTTLGCQLLCYLDLDPEDDPSVLDNVDSLIRLGTSHTGSQQWNFNMPKMIPMAKRADVQFYYTGPNKDSQRWDLQAKAWIVQVTKPVDFNGNAITTDIESGSLFFDWTCELHTRQVNDAAIMSNLTGDTGVTLSRTAGTTNWEPTFLIGGEAFLLPRRRYVCSFSLTSNPTANQDGTSVTIEYGNISVGQASYTASGRLVNDSTNAVFIQTDANALPESQLRVVLTNEFFITGDYQFNITPVSGTGGFTDAALKLTKLGVGLRDESTMSPSDTLAVLLRKAFDQQYYGADDVKQVARATNQVIPKVCDASAQTHDCDSEAETIAFLEEPDGL